jgi:hypothetical protein
MEAMPEFPGNIPPDVPFPYVRPFIIGFFPLTKAQFHLNPAVFEVKGQGDKGIALFIHPPGDTFYFLPVQEQFFFPIRIVVKKGGEGVFRNLEGTEPNFPLNQLRPGVGEGNFALPEGFYLGPQKGDAAFVTIVHGIIEPGLAVKGDNF